MRRQLAFVSDHKERSRTLTIAGEIVTQTKERHHDKQIFLLGIRDQLLGKFSFVSSAVFTVDGLGSVLSATGRSFGSYVREPHDPKTKCPSPPS